jgi:transglutaminase/protease-like cytokinesis protein 3
MRKLIAVLILLCSSKVLLAQATSHSVATKKGKVADVLCPSLLVKKLTDSSQTDEQKVRAIFHWITDNIAYNTLIYQRPSRAYMNRYKPYEPEDDTSNTLLPLNERVARIVLQRKVAVCDGYTRLFKVLCDYAGVQSEIIYGYARTNIGRVGQQFLSNHAWNAVYINKKWQLLDVTWASGYISFGSDLFIKHLNENYYLAPPNLFVEDHYPEQAHWTLLQSPPTLSEFKNSPLKSQDFIKYRIQSFKPAAGVIEAAVGDTLVFELNTEEKGKKLFVSPNPFLELGVLPLINWKQTILKPLALQQNSVSYTYVVTTPHIQQLCVLLNGRLILQYKVKIRDSMVVK